MLLPLSVLAVVLALTACNRSHHEHSSGEQPGHEHAAAAKYTCPAHPDVVQDKPGKCPKCGMTLKEAASGGHKEGAHGGHAAEPTLKATVTTQAPLQVGQKAEAVLRLAKRDGSPVLLSDLKDAHTKKIHLLINDQSLTDYHHEHPVPTGTPGEYAFSFTPRKPGAYRVWADLLPVASDAQEYSMTDIAASTQGEPITEREIKTVDEVERLKYEVVFDKTKLTVGEAAMGKLKITQPDGKIFTQLEPIMATYAHLVAFGEDYKSIVHIHPMGAEPTKDTDRGAGSLEFHIQPEQPGLMRLYAQVQIGGVSKFARFTLQVTPSQK
ncbi:MAG: hypothetical protein HY011_33840 [Acidobacteria bacterium]|nr:hypothetical protein [Acidobacteriota bacterium]